MSYILFENPSEIEPRAFTLLGGSTKRDSEGKFGFFGSGNKYSIAYMLRNGIDFKVFSGEREIKFTTDTVSLGNKNFEVIYVDGQETSLTVDAGPGWSAWQVFREQLCNMIDAGGTEAVFTDDDAKGVEGYTRIYIDAHSDVGSTYSNMDDYFSFNMEPANINEHGTLYKNKTNTDSRVYRRGILVHNDVGYIGMDFGYHVDLPDADINESRELTAALTNDFLFSKVIFGCDDISIIKDIIAKMPKGYHPYVMCLSDEWKHVLTDYVLYTPQEERILSHNEEQKGLCIHSDFIREIEGYGVNVTRPARVDEAHREYTIIDHDDVHPMKMRKLRKVCSMLMYTGIEIHVEDILIVDFFEANTLGMYDRQENAVCIGNSALGRGVSDILLTVLEECLHRDSGQSDYTRAFQDAILQYAVSLIDTLHIDN